MWRMTAPRRRWFRFAFSLRSLFVVVTLCCCWLAYQLNWIRQRHAYLKTSGTWEEPLNYGPIPEPRPPWPLGWFGERGEIWVGRPKGMSQADAERVGRLFPESNGRGTPLVEWSDEDAMH
jgi:hypothetical protein